MLRVAKKKETIKGTYLRFLTKRILGKISICDEAIMNGFNRPWR